MRRHLPSLAALLLAAGLVTWVRLLPLGLPALEARADAAARGAVAAQPQELAATRAAERARLDDLLRYRDAAGRRWPWLGDLDSYAWLRAARNALRHGSPCDAHRDGRCRDELTLAPLGRDVPLDRSLHVAAIAAVHRLARRLDPDWPLPASAFLVPALTALLAVVPAFAIGRRLGGPLGGAVAAVVVNLQPLLLTRSLGSDDDLWHVALPLLIAWALLAALQARRARDRVLLALGAAAVACLHAVTWAGWSFAVVALSGGLAAATALLAAAGWRRQGAASGVRAPAARGAALVLAVFVAGVALAAPLAGAREPLAAALARIASALMPAESPPAAPGPPSALTLVAELGAPTLGGVAAQAYGHLLFFAGWLGMLLLLLPRRRWRAAHFLVLIAGTLLYRALLGAALAPPLLVALLAAPLLAAALVEVRDGEAADLAGAALGAVIAVWLLAALLQAFAAARFIILLAAPLGLAIGGAAGRLFDWLAEALRARLGRPRLATALAAAAVLALLALPLRAGHAAAARYAPLVDGAWVGVLEHLRDTTPADTIVVTWWDFGYWAKFFAERRVSADGGALLTAVPYWLARLQTAAGEAEALGLLRMLACGSDARPYPEGEAGAMARLQRAGLDEPAAVAAVAALAVRDRAAAAEHLAGLGLDAAARAAVLEATHCAPPPLVLVLSSEQLPLAGMWRLGAWRPGAPTGEPAGLLTTDWAPCVPAGEQRRCRLPLAAAGDGGVVEAVVFPDGRPQDAVLEVRRDGELARVTPARRLLAGPMDVAAIAAGDPGAPAILLDGQQRVLVGRPAALDSLLVRLLLLDGRGLRHFRPLDARTGARQQRVAAWAVTW